MAFDGFGHETQAFLARLAANNDRDWFNAHRADYDAHIMAPAIAFVEAMAGPLAAIDPRIAAEARLNGSIRRLNREALVLVRCRYQSSVEAVKDAGATAVVSEEVEASARLLRLWADVQRSTGRGGAGKTR